MEICPHCLETTCHCGIYLDRSKAEIARLRADFNDCNLTRELLKQQVIKLRAALELHRAIAELDRKSGDDLLWTPQYEEACEATRKALANEQSTT